MFVRTLPLYQPNGDRIVWARVYTRYAPGCLNRLFNRTWQIRGARRVVYFGKARRRIVLSGEELLWANRTRPTPEVLAKFRQHQDLEDVK